MSFTRLEEEEEEGEEGEEGELQVELQEEEVDEGFSCVREAVMEDKGNMESVCCATDELRGP